MLGGGKRTASMIYVDDLVRGLIIMGTHKNAVGQVYYIVSEPEVDIDELGRMIAQIMGKKALTVHVPVWPAYAFTVLADPFARIFNFQTVINRYRMVEYRECCWLCDGSKAQRELGFKPEVKLKEALERCYVWYREAGWI